MLIIAISSVLRNNSVTVPVFSDQHPLVTVLTVRLTKVSKEYFLLEKLTALCVKEDKGINDYNIMW